MRAPDFNHWRQIPLDVEHFDYLRNSPWKRFWSGLWVTVVTGLTAFFDRLVFGLRVVGKENRKALGKQGAVVICNHVHWLDCTLLLGALWPRRQHFISLQSNLQLPVIRHIVRVGRCMPVPQETRLLPQFSAAIDQVLSQGQTLNIYPEGWLEPYHPGLRPFHNGAFSHAQRANVPILPTCITFAPRKGVWRIKRRPSMTLHILPPVYPDPTAPKGTEVVRLRKVCFAAMEECIKAHTTVDAWSTQNENAGGDA